jgi:FAD/FMN-containing dehydrogenase
MSTAGSFLTDIKTFIETDHVRTDPESCTTYGQDWTRLFRPNPQAVVLPGTIAQVQQLVHLANVYGVALVPSGGRTGLSGGAVAANGEVVVSFERMQRILAFDPVNYTVTCEPGVVTQSLQEYAENQGLFYPIDFAARGSSQIGGNIATNAGGIKVIRYGLTRDWVTGLKVITGQGDLLDLNKGLIKNASGYDLRHVFIGSEGTLGFLVEATLKLTLPPISPNVILLAVPTLDALMDIFKAFRQQLTLTAFEFFSAAALNHVLAKGLQAPFDTETPYYVLAEFETPSSATTDTALDVFSRCAEQGLLKDGIISQSATQAQDMWRLREDITESIAPYLPYKNDISVQISKVSGFLADIDPLLTQHYPDFEVIWFGHIGDGNLHISVLKPELMPPEQFVAKCQRVNELLFTTLHQHGGSISAEHGVGLTKKPYLHYTREATEVNYLRALKKVFDPHGIMNPGKIFDY